MPGRSPAEAVKAFADPLQHVASCITKSQFVLSSNAYSLGGPHSIGLGIMDDAVPLKAGPRKFRLAAEIGFDVIENDRAERSSEKYRVKTRQYRYHLMTESLEEILLWHWHPEGASDFEGPHLHVGAMMLNDGGISSVMQHVPTGRTAFEEVAHHLVVQCRVDTVRSRDEAVEVIMSSLQKFHQYRSWSVAPDVRVQARP